MSMWERDAASQSLGMELIEVGNGSAVISMTIAEQHVNGLGVCHGGFLFTLADSAMAFASNSPDCSAFAVSAHIEFLAPAKLGDRLVATATEQWQQGRGGLYDVAVTNQTGIAIAHFRGKTIRSTA
jgi:acyl-CoA thioesterase